MGIKARMGISIDGYVATPDGTPTLIKAAGFVPGQSHGFPEFIQGCGEAAAGAHRLRRFGSFPPEDAPGS